MISPEWVGVGLLGASQVATIALVFWKNGRSTKNAIREEMVGLREGMSDIKETCAGTRASFSERLDGHDRELKEGKKP